jgi:uncharacterized protein
MTLINSVLIFITAFLAGALNSVAGGGTLITFPALIGLGLDPKIANATSTVALWPGLIAGIFGYRREISSARSYLIPLGLTSLVGGALGTVLLIATPSQTFSRMVPYLILFATLLFMLQGSVSRWFRSASINTNVSPFWWVLGLLFLVASTTYGAYFGAGNGITLLAILGVLNVHDIHKANGLKSVIATVLNSIAIVGFILADLVAWGPALLMSGGAVAGGYLGANLARRVDQVKVRRAIVVIGLSMGIYMFWKVNH